MVSAELRDAFFAEQFMILLEESSQSFAMILLIGLLAILCRCWLLKLSQVLYNCTKVIIIQFAV